MKKLLPVFFMALLVTACGDKKEKEVPPKGSDAKIPVKIFKAQKKTVINEIQTSGRITSDNETYLGFKIGGVVQNILVEKGDKVRKGQLLAQLDLTEIQAQVNQAKEGVEKAQRDFERAQNLFRDSVATLEQKQNARTALDVAGNQLEIARFNLSFAQIRAPESGFVLEKMANRGQVVGPGTPVLQVGGNVSGKGKWLLTVGVSDAEWAVILLGDSAIISADAFGDQTYAAKVSRKAQSINPRTSTFDIDIELLQIPEKVASGLFAEVTIYPSQASEFWEIPYEALLDGDKNNAFVFTTKDQQTAQMSEVTVHKVSENGVLVSKGLEGNPFVIASGSAYLKDNSPIMVRK